MDRSRQPTPNRRPRSRFHTYGLVKVPACHLHPRRGPFRSTRPWSGSHPAIGLAATDRLYVATTSGPVVLSNVAGVGRAEGGGADPARRWVQGEVIVMLGFFE